MAIEVDGFVGQTEATVTMQPGKRFQVRYWDPGETSLFDETVPEGELWTIKVELTVTKADAE